ncbi:bilirubin oxidase [Stachybotrys elegans]|uniref:Bilirubin oxidase n=1 Tax=Stachybotrys elegans TaxID=80388 RepID=A0A8K0SR95_9HYPO|nr:bilirubin oxidase [Stachybotrys elegans]
MIARCIGLVALSQSIFSHVLASPTKHTGPVRRQSPSLSPALPLYDQPLPIPPVKEPKMIITNPTTGEDILYYEVEIRPFTKSIYGSGNTSLVGYDGIAPGPTFLVERGQETVVRFINNSPSGNSVHLHGSPSRAPFDGWAEDITEPGEYKDYYYPNQQSARTLWYHDHAMRRTAEDVYMGQAGMYILHDPAEDALNLPSGYGEYDIPLIISSKQYNDDGTLFSTEGNTDSVWGDVIHVNGQPWPYMEVEPRKYRLRLLNAAVSRSFGLYFATEARNTTRIPYDVIASDAGLLSSPAETTQLYLSNGERYELVFDFSEYAGQNVDLLNIARSVGGIGVDPDYANTNKVMRFRVSPNPPQEEDTSEVPSELREVPFPTPDTTVDHVFRFARTNGIWTINGVRFSDVANRLLANVPRGTVQRWQLENNNGGWSHPIHLHLVDFRIVARGGARRVLPYESQGLKDVVWLGVREVVIVEAHYAPYPGVYMFHCHNLIHEDFDMMASFNTTVLPEYGYNASSFIDPMEDLWRARPFTLSDFSSGAGEFSESAITQRIQFMASYEPYQTQ